ncbi:MAG: pyruvate kinase [Desulfuromonadales bacterium]|nr:pyruvate kinase [Desulfuromonadales bacterium]MBN2793087.1 pyruvate kinase [Desulfuromonadales bacterium]
MFRSTKIVATIGPATESEEQLGRLMKAGVNVFRLNFSHGDHENKETIIALIRKLSLENKNAVAILGDLQGPKIRTGLMKNGSLLLTPGSEVVITTRDVSGEGALIPTSYADLPTDVVAGNRILLDDGLIELKVKEASGTDVTCEVIHGGLLKDRKGINLPGVNVSAPALTQKDLADLDFCIAQELDYVALSFVRQATDVLVLKSILNSKKSSIQVIAKIEKPEAVQNFPEILEAADGIMVARGDLGVEISPEKVPLIQKGIIRQCKSAGKPVITATQMLESMISNPRPTRAETSDVANAILDGTDAVMLSGETAAGKYPIEAVEVMVRVAQDVEADPQLKTHVFQPVNNPEGAPCLTEAIGQAACHVAENVGAKAILAFTQTGSTAALVAKYRPNLPIIAVTPSKIVRRRLALYAGVHVVRVNIEGNTEAQIDRVNHAVLEKGWLHAGDLVVLTMGSPLSDPGTTNLMKVHRLKA